MASLSELIAQRDKLNSEIEQRNAATRTEGIAQIRALMEKNGLTVADIRSTKSVSNDTGKRARKGAPNAKKILSTFQ